MRNPSLSHSATASCLTKMEENLPSGLKASDKMMIWFFEMNACDFSEILNLISLYGHKANT